MSSAPGGYGPHCEQQWASVQEQADQMFVLAFGGARRFGGVLRRSWAGAFLGAGERAVSSRPGVYLRLVQVLAEDSAVRMPAICGL